MEDSFYLDKYLKYKNKYLNLKEHIGGTTQADAASLANYDNYNCENGKEFAKSIVYKNGNNLQNLKNFKDCKEVVLEAVKNNGIALQYALPVLQKDEEIVLAAVTKNGLALKFADPDLKKKFEIVDAAIKSNTHAITLANYDDFKCNNTKELNLVKSIVKINENMLQKLKNFINCKEVVLEAVRNHGYALQHAPELINDEDVVLEAVKKNGDALKYASNKMKEDEKIVLAAVKNNGIALEHALPIINNEKVVLAAVKQNGLALQYALPELKKNKKIVLAAVEQNGDALEYASPELNDDIEILLICYQYKKINNKKDLKVISNKIKKLNLNFDSLKPSMEFIEFWREKNATGELKKLKNFFK